MMYAVMLQQTHDGNEVTHAVEIFFWGGLPDHVAALQSLTCASQDSFKDRPGNCARKDPPLPAALSLTGCTRQVGQMANASSDLH